MSGNSIPEAVLSDANFMNVPLDRPSGDKMWECYQMMPCPCHISLLRPAMNRIPVAVREEQNGTILDDMISFDKDGRLSKTSCLDLTVQHHCSHPPYPETFRTALKPPPKPYISRCQRSKSTTPLSDSKAQHTRRNA